MAAAGAIISGIGAIGGLAMQAKAVKAQERAMEAQQKMQELADARARRRLLREVAINRGTTVNLAANLGATGSSSVAGGLGGLVNQQMGQLGFQQQTLDISKFITQQNIKATNAMSQASMFGGLSDMFGSFFRSLPRTGPIASPYPSIGGGFAPTIGYGNQAARAGF